MKNRQLHIVISGGGTGGHIFPALAIADALSTRQENISILFIGAKGKMEMSIVPNAGYQIKALPITGFYRSLDWRNLLFPFRLLFSIIKSWFILNRFKPDIAIGTGGFASGPLLKVAQWKNIPTVLQEQNSYPGVTNKLLGNKAKKIFGAFDELGAYFDPEKVVITGNPLRQSVCVSLPGKEEACTYFKLDPSLPVLLLTGGSLGAKTLNEAAEKSISLLEKNRVQIIWQCGKLYEEKYMPLATKERHITAFVDRMDYAYAAADIVIARAGASTISELALVGKPTILVPSPNVAEDHQTKNVQSLVDREATVLVKDSEAKDQLFHTAIDLLQNSEKRNRLGNNIKQYAKPNAAEHIAREIINILSSET